MLRYKKQKKILQFTDFFYEYNHTATKYHSVNFHGNKDNVFQSQEFFELKLRCQMTSIFCIKATLSNAISKETFEFWILTKRGTFHFMLGIVLARFLGYRFPKEEPFYLKREDRNERMTAFSQWKICAWAAPKFLHLQNTVLHL